MMQERQQKSEKKLMTLDEMEQLAFEKLESLRVCGCDVQHIETYMKALKARYETEWARTKYLEGYSETLFTKIVMMESK